MVYVCTSRAATAIALPRREVKKLPFFIYAYIDEDIIVARCPLIDSGNHGVCQSQRQALRTYSTWRWLYAASQAAVRWPLVTMLPRKGPSV